MRGFSIFLAGALGFASVTISRALELGPRDNSTSPDCVNDANNRQCWSGPWGNFDINTDYYENTPDTGVIVEVHDSTFHRLIIIINQRDFKGYSNVLSHMGQTFKTC